MLGVPSVPRSQRMLSDVGNHLSLLAVPTPPPCLLQQLKYDWTTLWYNCRSQHNNLCHCFLLFFKCATVCHKNKLISQIVTQSVTGDLISCIVSRHPACYHLQSTPQGILRPSTALKQKKVALIHNLSSKKGAKSGRKSKISTECITPIDFFFWPVKCIKTKKYSANNGGKI